MKHSITVYCDNEQDWVGKKVAEAFDKLVEEIEAHCKEHSVGLPWVLEYYPDDEYGPGSGYEPSTAIEVDVVSQQNWPNKTPFVGASWTLYDWMWKNNPPKKDKMGEEA